MEIWIQLEILPQSLLPAGGRVLFGYHTFASQSIRFLRKVLPVSDLQPTAFVDMVIRQTTEILITSYYGLLYCK
jgi:hypothetical protein